jgi:hypothetical protein
MGGGSNEPRCSCQMNCHHPGVRMTFVAVVLAMTAADQNAELRIRTIVQGTDSRIAVHRELVIRSAHPHCS